MADTRKDIWNDDDGEEERKPRRGQGLRRFLLFFLTLAAVLGILGSAAGTLLAFYLVFLGSYELLTPLSLVVFLLLWLVPVLLV